MNDILKQQHSIANNNAQQLFSSFVTWYTFFWTLNMAALAVLYSPQAMQVTSTQSSCGRLMLSAVFVILNGLGTGLCYFGWKSISQLNSEATAVVKNWITTESDSSTVEPSAGLLPSDIMNYVFAAGALSLILNIIAWGVLPIVG